MSEEKTRWQRYAERHPETVAAHNSSRNKRAYGKWKTRWYQRWMWINSRCHCPKAGNFAQYGGKGIECRVTVLDLVRAWFRDNVWMMKQPECDRIDPQGHYEVTNIRYVEKVDNLSRRFGNDSPRQPGEEG